MLDRDISASVVFYLVERNSPPTCRCHASHRLHDDWLQTFLESEMARPTGFMASQMTVVTVSQSDIRAFARAELEGMKGEVDRALRRSLDAAARAHLRDVQARIEVILEGKKS